MFRMFSNYLNKKKDEDLKDDTKAQVFIWSGSLSSPGHVALQLDTKNTKDTKNDPSNYVSIWPKSTPAGGLTSIFPLKAALCRKLETDCSLEGSRTKTEFDDLLDPIESNPVPPDKQFQIEGLDKKKIKNELKRLERGIEQGEVRYQLLPGVNIPRFFNKLLPTPRTEPEIYNCVTFTQHLLQVGGIDKLPKSNWTTPAKFGENLSKLSAPAQEDNTPKAARP